MLAFLVPLVPLVGAAHEPQTCAEACAWLPLYVTAGSVPTEGFPSARGFSSLVGDAMPSDQSTHASSVVRAITRETDGLRLARENTFHVELVSPQSYTYVEGDIRVLAVDAAGGHVVLGSVPFGRPPAPTPAEIALTAVNGVEPAGNAIRALGSASGALNAHWNNSMRNYDALADSLGAGPASAGANATYAELCKPGTWESLQCRAVTGRPVQSGALDMCRPTPPANFPLRSILGPPVWSARMAVDDAARGSPLGQAVVCHAYYNNVNASAATIDAQVGEVDVFPAAPPYPGGTLANATTTNATPPHAWRNVTFNATVPSHFPQGSDAFSVPNGYRLALDVSLSGLVATTSGYVRAPIRFEVGRADAPTALVIRHATPGAFSAFATDAAPILPGVHTGFFANLTDADDYAFTAPAGSIIDLTRLAGASVGFTLYNADGLATSTTNPSLRVAGAPGRWTLRITASDALPDVSEYSFRLALDQIVGEADEGIFLANGWAQGTLGVGDNSDTYTVFGWKAQRIDMTLYFPSAAGYQLDVDDMQLWDVSSESGLGYASVSGRLPQTGYYAMRVVRAHGAGPYEVGVSPDAEGNLTFVPEFAAVITPPAFESFGGLTGSGDGVYYSNESTLFHFSPSTGQQIVRDGWEKVQGVSAEGSLLRTSVASGVVAMSLDSGSIVNPLVRSGKAVFGTDAVYGLTLTARPYRMAADRSVEYLTGNISKPHEVLAAPNGQVYFVNETVTQRYDASQGALVPADPLAGVLAFGSSGAQYRILNSTLVERTEPWSGNSKVVARSSQRISELVASGPYLYARLVESTAGPRSLAMVAAPEWGFSGFSPSFVPRMAPELRVVDIRESDVNTTLVPPSQSRTFRVTIANDGGATAAAFNVSLQVQATVEVLARGSFARAPSIAPQTTATVELTWSQNGSVGDEEGLIWVDPFFSGDEVVELDEENNLVYFQTHAWVGGDREICRAALGTVPWPSHPIVDTVSRNLGLGDGDAVRERACR